jgi:TRAP-type C4-dicarboxylate transport system permease large subunit
VKPVIGYLGLLTVVLLILAFVPSLTLWLPTMLGYR